MKKDRLNTLIAALLFAAAFIVLVIILIASLKAVKNLAAGYTALRNADLSKTVTGTLMYDDGFYGQILHGIETDPADPAAAETMNNFLSSSMRAIDTRIFSAGLIYTMVISVLSSFLIYLRCRENTIKHLFCTAASVFIPYIVFILAVFAFHAMQGVPFCFPDSHGFFLILTGLLSLTAGGSFLAVFYRKIPWKKTAAILALPLAFGLFLLNMNMEAGLYNS